MEDYQFIVDFVTPDLANVYVFYQGSLVVNYITLTRKGSSWVPNQETIELFESIGLDRMEHKPLYLVQRYLNIVLLLRRPYYRMKLVPKITSYVHSSCGKSYGYNLESIKVSVFYKNTLIARFVIKKRVYFGWTLSHILYIRKGYLLINDNIMSFNTYMKWLDSKTGVSNKMVSPVKSW